MAKALEKTSEKAPEKTSVAVWRWIAALLVPSLVAGCVAVPTAEDYRAGEAVLPAPAPGVARDLRAGFRQVFCATLAQDVAQGVAQDVAQDVAKDDRGCGEWLWRLADESPAAAPAPLPALDRNLRVFVVGGAFSDCFGAASLAWGRAVGALSAAGYPVAELPIASRSSASANADLIAGALRSDPPAPGQRTLLVGYSKGAVDILHFLGEYPRLAARVDAVVSVAGPVRGSQVASSGAWAYDTLLVHAFAGRCDPGDGGVVDSLLPERRQRWLAAHALPAHIRYFMLEAFTTRERIARALRPSWQLLARRELRNDGQLMLSEGLWPGSSLLGYANTDHWGVAIDIERELETLAARDDDAPFPRAALFEAIVRFVARQLGEGA
ncbi:hypothetical protein [Parahaliea mediterranea]|uniref:Alpha/beta hydrolase n=1 Tax=Parahaliea mediterranea TaxID=651086 RepID=A0A939DIC4_9GAMM|nr:hypothetical protein [Parahaliea mediterranea]MBN7798067.1 hypothetical protein [Parahaliea mediterranea]